MESVARVIPLGGKVGQARERATPERIPLAIGGDSGSALQPLGGDALILVPDQQLDALGALFQMSPLRRVMTFEAYLIMKGFAPDFAG